MRDDFVHTKVQGDGAEKFEAGRAEERKSHVATFHADLNPKL